MRPWAWYLSVALMITCYGVWQWQRLTVEPDVAPLLPAALPSMVNADSASWLKQMVGHDLWSSGRGHADKKKHGEKSSVEPEKKANASSVFTPQLMAVSRAMGGGASLAMFQIEKDQPAQPFLQGMQLPDGSHLQKILADGVVLEMNGEMQYVYLFGKHE